MLGIIEIIIRTARRLMLMHLTMLILGPALLYSGVIDKNLETPVVEVISTSRFFDPMMPWRSSSPIVRTGHGVVISENEVICPEPLIRGQRLVELRMPRSARKHSATVVAADPHAGIALLRSAEPLPAKGYPLDESPQAAATEISVYQIDETGSVQTVPGRIAHYAVRSLPQTPHSIIMLSAFAEQSIAVSSGLPLMLNNRSIAGIVLSTDDGGRTAHTLPSVIIKRFLEDASTPPFSGLPSAGFVWSPLPDPFKRSYLGLDDDAGGIIVISTLPGSGAAEVLKPQDVILAWNGYSIDENGFYNDTDYGRLLMPHLVSGHGRPGSMADVDLIRDGKRIRARIQLNRWKDRQNLIPENFTGDQWNYLVEGGLIITELTGNYLRTYGQDWETKVDPKLLHRYSTRRSAPEFDGQRIVILSAVLPDEINTGYQNFRDEIITHANGQLVNNLNDLREIRRRDGVISRLRFDGMHIDIVLDADALPAANDRIQAGYHIPELIRIQ